MPNMPNIVAIEQFVRKELDTRDLGKLDKLIDNLKDMEQFKDKNEEARYESIFQEASKKRYILEARKKDEENKFIRKQDLKRGFVLLAIATILIIFIVLVNCDIIKGNKKYLNWGLGIPAGIFLLFGCIFISIARTPTIIRGPRYLHNGYLIR